MIDWIKTAQGVAAIVAAIFATMAIYRWGWQLAGSEELDEAYVPFFGAVGAAG